MRPWRVTTRVSRTKGWTRVSPFFPFFFFFSSLFFLLFTLAKKGGSWRFLEYSSLSHSLNDYISQVSSTLCVLGVICQHPVRGVLVALHVSIYSLAFAFFLG
ncbi:hypothetical protein IWZ03DRAFT_243571 [Phyllosticta citriasiana]|uniref:Uncharacterized protein n=1 Tax=Phyllosticta citriasiana TaxID=595635 RepID=A0ABR1KFQ5_9PEZI